MTYSYRESSDRNDFFINLEVHIGTEFIPRYRPYEKEIKDIANEIEWHDDGLIITLRPYKYNEPQLPKLFEIITPATVQYLNITFSGSIDSMKRSERNHFIRELERFLDEDGISIDYIKGREFLGLGDDYASTDEVTIANEEFSNEDIIVRFGIENADNLEAVIEVEKIRKGVKRGFWISGDVIIEEGWQVESKFDKALDLAFKINKATVNCLDFLEKNQRRYR